MNQSKLRFLKNSEIDLAKWDRCVAGSSFALVYAESWYLDVVAPGWSALIYGDYDFVMPLLVKQKLGFKFLLQAIFAQQQGIFPEPGPEIQHSFLKFISEQFHFVRINLNSSHSNPFPEVFSVEKRDNFLLDLSGGYDFLKTNYTTHTRRKIKKAETEKVFVVKGLAVNDYIDLKNHANDNKLAKKPMQTLTQLIASAQANGKGTIYAAYNRDNSLCAAAFFLHTKKRTVYLNAVSTPEGKRTNAMHLLVDRFICDHSNDPLILDFEGSSIPGIARFYRGFGAVPESYFVLKSNRLPVPLRWLIKFLR